MSQQENQDLVSQTPSGPVGENHGVNYETMCMIKTDPVNHQFMPCGFLKNGQIRPIYGNSLIGRLRRYHHNHGTSPKLMVCITMYNEDVEEFKTTMRGVLQNIEVLAQDPHTNIKKNDVLVVLCCDGAVQIPQSFIDYLTERKALDFNLLKEKGFATFDETTQRYKMRDIEDFMEQGQESYPNNLLHMFGTTLDDFGIEDADSEYYRGRKVNFMFALKHNNNGKVNSFKWLFQGVARYLQPRYVQKLDIGTRAGPYSLAKLYKHLEATPDCGGCCSEVVIDTECEKARQSWSSYYVTLMQYYEFKQTIAYFKTFEGWGRFIMALPGCYSMYRYEAIKGEPLDKFFKLINMQQEPTCWEANEYLVEDRLLSNNVYYQKGAGYTCDFVIDAPAYTDAPPNLETLMKQRRRWSNGFLFGELTTLLNTHNIFGFNGQTHSVLQRLRMLLYMPLLGFNKLMGQIAPAILLTQMKYLIVYSAYAHFNTPEFKAEHPAAWQFFTNDPSSVGFQSVVNLTLLAVMIFSVLASIGAQIQDMMGYFRAVLIFFQCYTLFCQIGTVSMIRNFGLRDADGHLNLYVLQFVLGWVSILWPFFMKPIDALQNLGKYIMGFNVFYFSYGWWYNIITIYSFCNLDDVTWGNRPSNASKGLNVVVDDAKRQEILRQSYRKSRTNILIGWLMFNLCIMFVFDALILSAVHNSNLSVKETCQKIIWGYACYTCCTVVMMSTLSFIHHSTGILQQLMCSRYQPARIEKRPPVSSDPETKVLLDDTEEEENFTPPIQYKKKMASKKGKSDFETDEDQSFMSDDIEAHQFLQKYKKKGGWTY